jgi:CDP-glucose 4,6-dehydratase
MAFSKFYSGRKVLVTGHTGFKGAWLCEWLLSLGAIVKGLGLDPSTVPGLYNQLQLTGRVDDVRGDIRDFPTVFNLIDSFKPEIIFHLAAQPLVRISYDCPIETYATNIMGTVHILDAVRQLAKPCIIIVVTTDKCYENREWVYAYREEDPFGGYDPYSSSKGAVELVVNAYRRSFFNSSKSQIRLASARAGNVIGGGDWAKDRIIPDCIRALGSGMVIKLRNSISTRPWQHVLEPLSGYLTLGAQLGSDGDQSEVLSSGFNFGPGILSNRTVLELVDEVLKHWPGKWESSSSCNEVHEAKLLNLAIDKAQHYLKWKPIWSFERAVQETVTWYINTNKNEKQCKSETIAQIQKYTEDAKLFKLGWSQ